MEELIKELDKNLKLDNYTIEENNIILDVSSARATAACPFCGKESPYVHSKYTRSFQDLPIQNKKVKISLANRKFLCKNLECSHTTFAERFDFIKHKAKKTNRLEEEIYNIANNVSSLTATSLLNKHTVDIGKSTVFNVLKKRALRK